MVETPLRTCLCLLFADIADSTGLYRDYGDERGRKAVTTCLRILEETAGACGGNIVDRIGDEVFCSFETADQAADAAVQMQEEVARARSEDLIPTSASIRVGFHFGPVIRDEEGIFGDAVHTAKRTSSLAKREQIVTTAETLDKLTPFRQLCSRALGRTNAKGKRGAFSLHEIVWDQALLTVDDETEIERENIQLIIETDASELSLDQHSPTLSIGRSRGCDLVIEDQGISRLHARIEYRGTHFVVSDVSRNGTVLMHGPNEVLLVREERRLEGQGLILVGRTESGVLRYRVVDR